VSLRIHGGALEIQNGLTHYPQRRETSLFFRCDADLPEAAFPLMFYDRSLAKRKIRFICIDLKGDIVCVAGAQVLQPILIACAGNWKPAKTPSREINIAAR
jgi:hypothetical protein